MESEHGRKPPQQCRFRRCAPQYGPDFGIVDLGPPGEQAEVELPVIRQSLQKDAETWMSRHHGSVRTWGPLIRGRFPTWPGFSESGTTRLLSAAGAKVTLHSS
ncbi:hypothetical protein ACFWWT_46600 [Streptomyces sp. NPDC058676]|uniref:hypothetical protein n=1 Tax=unclassified Streptomyces TaxID=2593676 RepID=UPI0036637080